MLFFDPQVPITMVIAGWYSMKIMEAGMIGFSFTNTSPVVVPTRSKQVGLRQTHLHVKLSHMNHDRQFSQNRVECDL